MVGGSSATLSANPLACAQMIHPSLSSPEPLSSAMNVRYSAAQSALLQESRPPAHTHISHVGHGAGGSPERMRPQEGTQM